MPLDGERRADMYRVDITADLNDEDDTGYVWTFLDEARDPGQIKAVNRHLAAL